MEKQIDNQSINLKGLKEREERLASVLNPYGFECHPLKIGWYNEQVGRDFRLPYHEDTLAFVIISAPSMFEKAFIPFVSKADWIKTCLDPLDQCMMHYFSLIKEEFSSDQIETIHDFELSPHRRPKILVQTAGHVSGAVRYYQRKDIASDPWDSSRKVFGVCLHPSYGGWFALRGVAIYTNITCPNLPKHLPRDILTTEADIVKLLQLYNDHWQDWSFRDIIPVKERYSQEQREYFSNMPGERMKLIEKYSSSFERSVQVFESSP